MSAAGRDGAAAGGGAMRKGAMAQGRAVTGAADRAGAEPVVVVGAGLAGLLTALHLAPAPVLLLSGGALGTQSSSAWAQGGVAAAVGADDSVALQLADTVAAGAGLCDAAAAARIVGGGPAAIEVLAGHGVRFDRDAAGALCVGLEAAHSRRRIVHAAGDGTGREIVRALVEAVRACASVTVMEGVAARRLLLRDGRVCGVLAQRQGEDGCVAVRLAASRVVLATGGIGGLFRHTTNPAGSYGAGIAIAALAGARLRGMEFVQFHPTALDVGRDPMPLVSEAVRGEGGVLVDGDGARVMAGFARGDLEPRDVVSREVWRVVSAGGTVRLDATAIEGFAARFPAIAASCRAAGIDPQVQAMPIHPAAHYHMGGVAVDAAGRSSVPGLWACGEVACTGLHGANRLASNSLLEAAVCARAVAEDVAAAGAGATRVGAEAGRAAAGGVGEDVGVPPAAEPASLRAVVTRGLGVLRDGAGLAAAVVALLARVEAEDAAADPARVALLVAVAALRRRRQVGSHWRTDAAGEAGGDAVGGAGEPEGLGELTLGEAMAEARRLRDAGGAWPLARSA